MGQSLSAVFARPQAIAAKTYDTTTLNQLPDHILVEIFCHLDQRCRIRMLKVNKRWRRLMPFDNLYIKHLPLIWPLGPNGKSTYYVDKSAVTSVLRGILPQIGPRLKSLDFGGLQLAPQHVNLIAQCCPNLRCIDLRKTYVSQPNEYNFNALQQMPKLNCLRLGFPNGLDWFLSYPEADRNRMLLEVSNLIRVVGLKKFHLVDLPFPPSFAAPNLTQLHIFGCESFSDDQLAEICSIATNLADFSVEKCWNLTDFRPIGRLTNLIELKLRSTHVDDIDMNVIARNCPELDVLKLDHSMCKRANDDDHLGSQITRLTWLRLLSTLKCLAIDLTKQMLADIPYPWAIEELQISADLSEAILLDLSDKSPWLKRLHLHHGSLSENVVAQLSDRWVILEELRLSNIKISDETVVQLCQRESLRRLDIRECYQVVSADCFPLLVAKRQELKVSIPLNIQLRSDRRDLIDLLNEQLRMVRVRLVA